MKHNLYKRKHLYPNEKDWLPGTRFI
jgi:hypothetical protein